MAISLSKTISQKTRLLRFPRNDNFKIGIWTTNVLKLDMTDISFSCLGGGSSVFSWNCPLTSILSTRGEEDLFSLGLSRLM